ncbi:MAG: hypothetical protein OEW05_00260 [Candidatus Aminicenantes bacterium]|nr:hypothetical protein [Candidatus Aminicenantes bacterium]
MTKRIATVVLAVVALAGLTLMAQDKIDVTGEWEMTRDTPRGPMTSTITFKQDGENLTVTTIGRDGQEIVSKGTIKGQDIEWSMTRSTPQGEFTIISKGKVEGDTMSGTTQMGERTSEWKAKRKAN